jgi:hypothetical protein
LGRTLIPDQVSEDLRAFGTLVSVTNTVMVFVVTVATELDNTRSVPRLFPETVTLTFAKGSNSKPAGAVNVNEPIPMPVLSFSVTLGPVSSV